MVGVIRSIDTPEKRSLRRFVSNLPPFECEVRWCIGVPANSGRQIRGARAGSKQLEWLLQCLDIGSQAMNRFGRVWLMLLLVAFATLPARAQVTVDVSKIT